MSLYGIIDDLRRSHPTPAASKTLDMVVAELGRSRDNLGVALRSLEGRAVPSGGAAVLQELSERAREEGVDDNETAPAAIDRAAAEPLDEATFGIGMLLGGSALLVVALGILAVILTFAHA